MKLFITKLKIILNSNFFYLGCIILALSLFLFCNFVIKKPQQEDSFSLVTGTIIDYKIGNGKTTLYLKGDTNSIVTFYEELTVLYGAKIEVKGEEKKIENQTIPHAFSYKDYLYNNDIYTNIIGEDISLIEAPKGIYWLKNKIRNRINKIDQRGYLLAFLLGDKNEIEETTYNNYSKIGVTHLFALSGMHVGVLSGILLFFFQRIKKKNFIVLIFLFLYGLLVGFPSSLKRCILFLFLNTLNKEYHLAISPTKILLLVFTLLVIQNNKILFDIGFLFSFFTVLGILAYHKWIISKNKFISSCKLSVVAFFFSLPIAFYSFYSVNFLSIFYNVFYIPYVSLLLYPLSLLTFLFPFLHPFFSFLINVLEQVTFFLSKIDFLTLYLSFSWHYIAIYYAMLLLYVKWKKKICILLSISLIIFKFFLPYWDASGYVYFFDVGQGDSCLIISPYRKDVILIDTGGITSYNKEPYYVSDNIISFLKYEGIHKINFLILSHGDSDHVKDSLHLAEEIKIEKVKINKGEINKLEKQIIENIKVGKYQPKGLKLQFLETKEAKNENDNSIFTLIKIYNTTILSSGDAGKQKEEEIIEKYKVKADIVKIGHHGSKTSSSKSYLESVNSQYAIISSGRNNRFGHPHKETLETLKTLSIDYANTQEEGTILFKINEKGITKFNFPP